MARLEEFEVRHALVTAFSRPAVLAEIVASSDDTASAAAAISTAFDLTLDQSLLILDQQLSQLTRKKLAVIRQPLDVQKPSRLGDQGA